MSDQSRLLDLQDHDTAIGQLTHRRAHLPEHDERRSLDDRLAVVEGELGGVKERLGAVASAQAGLEAEVAAAEARIAEIERRLYSGSVTASRDLQAMSAEVDHLKQRRSSLEDDVLAAMEEAEPLQAEVDRLSADRAGMEERRVELDASIGEQQATIDGELEVATGERAALAQEIPESLLATYERLRSKLDGVGAARLNGASCGGCHLTLPATEVARIRTAPADELVFCDQCGRILVR